VAAMAVEETDVAAAGSETDKGHIKASNQNRTLFFAFLFSHLYI